MVFSNLQAHEKDAFFSLLDEYFSSRPDIFANAGSSDGGEVTTGGAAASAVHRALASNPEATSRLVSAGLKHGVPKSSPYAAAASNPEINNAVGRVAAASFALSSRNNSNNSNTMQPPPAPPRRASSSSSSTPPSIADKPAGPGLVSTRKFGDVDTSSAKNMFSSLRNSTAKKSESPPLPPAPSAFAAKKNAFAPPPVRRVTPATSESSSPPPAPPPRHQPPPEEPEAEGEWAEALYDYSSEDPGDLEIQTGQRILVTERTSADWWTGDVGGKRGLFPASYVKIL